MALEILRVQDPSSGEFSKTLMMMIMIIISATLYMVLKH